MNNQWTLHVERFAKIECADIRLTPLMCFVGDNNSGKSYLMSLVWGILTLGKDVFPKVPSEGKAYKKCESWLKESINCKVELTSDVLEYYVNWFNELLANNKKMVLKKVFNYPVEIGVIEIRDYRRSKKLEVKWEPEGQRYSSGASYVKFPVQDEYTREQLLRMNSYLCWNILMEGIAAPLFTPTVKGRRMGEPVYLPASRTGFMLTYPQLVESSLQHSYASETTDNTSSLTLPYVDFLQLVTKFDVRNDLKANAKWASSYIEEEMIQGRLLVKKFALPVIEYLPKGSERAIPLYVSSSIVSEISPLLLLFKSNIDFKSMIIEEPEAHLHPYLQKMISRLIINLVNRGIPIWITTHSDTILQHINNMIMLKNNPEVNNLLSKYGYKKEDLLDEKDVSMYQFNLKEDGSSTLLSLDAGKFGFAVPTFNDAIDELVKEVYEFQGEE